MGGGGEGDFTPDPLHSENKMIINLTIISRRYIDSFTLKYTTTKGNLKISKTLIIYTHGIL